MVKSVVVKFILSVSMLAVFAQAEFRVLHEFSGPQRRARSRIPRC